MSEKIFNYHGKDFTVQLNLGENGNLIATIDNEETPLQMQRIDQNTLSFQYNNQLYNLYFAVDKQHVYTFVNGQQFIFDRVEKDASAYRSGDTATESGNEITAPMPGKIFKVFVKPGQKIAKNDRLFIVEAMKMENEVKSPRDGQVKSVNFKESDLVSVGEPVVELFPIAADNEKEPD